MRRFAFELVKSVHTAIWFTIEAAVLYLLGTGLLRRTDKRAAIAGAVVTAEIAIFAASGFRCPLTGVAEGLSDESGSVTDIYLPRWLAHNLPLIHVPLVVAIAYLHGRNLVEARRLR